MTLPVKEGTAILLPSKSWEPSEVDKSQIIYFKGKVKFKSDQQ